MLGAQAQVHIDLAEDHHGRLSADAPRTWGTVTRIRAVHCRYAPTRGGDSRALYPVPGSGVLSDIESADGWTPDHGDVKFVGYLVDLHYDGAGAHPT